MKRCLTITLTALVASSIASCSHPLDEPEFRKSVLEWTEMAYVITNEQMADANLFVTDDVLQRGIVYALVAEAEEEHRQMSVGNGNVESAEFHKYSSQIARARAEKALRAYLDQE